MDRADERLRPDQYARIDFETALSVYTGSSVSALTPVAANYDFTDPATAAQSQCSEVSFNAVQGTTYDISVDGTIYTSAVDGTSYCTSGDITLNVNMAPSAATSVPKVTQVTPTTLPGLPLPQTQLLTISGSGFTSASVLQFFDGTNYYNNRVPTYVNSNTLTYNIKVGEVSASWTVTVINPGPWKSNPQSFTVQANPGTAAPGGRSA